MKKTSTVSLHEGDFFDFCGLGVCWKIEGAHSGRRFAVVYHTIAPHALAAPLHFHLNSLGVDTLIMCGETTSGCVRASVVDAATHRYRVGVVARETGMMDADFVMGIPLSATGKST